MTKLEKAIQHHRELSRSGSEVEQGRSSASGGTGGGYHQGRDIACLGQ